jgi:hypothetical protein
MPRLPQRTEYCRQQAQDCASRATTTNLPELRDAYLQLEMGWLQLVPEFDPVPNISINPTGTDTDQPSQPDAPMQKTKKSPRCQK